MREDRILGIRRCVNSEDTIGAELIRLFFPGCIYKCTYHGAKTRGARVSRDNYDVGGKRAAGIREWPKLDNPPSEEI